QSWIEASALAIWVIVLTVLAAPGWRLNSFLASRPLRWLGQISYSTYITHFLVLIAIKRDFLGDANEGKFSFFLAILGLGTVTIILVSMAMYKFVEEPANRWARNWGRRRMAHLERRAAARQKDTTRSSDFPPHPPSNSEAASGA
ncbi:MAG: acyltransferase, partial [Rhodobiaceae bacterium]|nr:acyltransferase [Rhodobiaceae bacterium]